jgi:hypothetical protein
MQGLSEQLPGGAYLLNVSASIVATAIVALIGWFGYRLNMARRDRWLRGEWEAWWQPVKPGLPLWVGQKMRIRVGFRKLKLTSVPHGRVDHDVRLDKELQFEWGGEMEMRDQLYLCGSWRKPGGPGCGAFVLRRSNDDKYLCGYIVGANQDNDVKMGPFVLGKDRRDVLTGMRWMRENWRAFEPPEEMRAKL